LSRLLAALAFVAFALPGLCLAGTPKDYAYVFLQGRIADQYERHPLVGATIRLSNGPRVFEAVTDPKGVFVFDKLPVSSFTLDIVTSDGNLVDWFQEPNLSDPSRPRMKIKLGKNRGKSTLTIVAKESEERVQVVVEHPPARWGRFWKQFAIFGAAAVILSTR
jgi:hypothetical protein